MEPWSQKLIRNPTKLPEHRIPPRPRIPFVPRVSRSALLRIRYHGQGKALQQPEAIPPRRCLLMQLACVLRRKFENANAACQDTRDVLDDVIAPVLVGRLRCWHLAEKKLRACLAANHSSSPKRFMRTKFKHVQKSQKIQIQETKGSEVAVPRRRARTA